MKGVWLAFSLGWLCQLSIAEPLYRFDQELQNDALKKDVQHFLQKAEKMLPPLFKAHLPPLAQATSSLKAVMEAPNPARITQRTTLILIPSMPPIASWSFR